MATFAELERAGWHERAPVYSETTALATTQAIPALLAAVRPRAGLELLDLCTGPGYAAGAAAAIGCRVSGIDFAEAMVTAAKTRFPDCGFSVGDAESLDWNDNSFDCVVCNFGVFHLGEPEKVFAEAYRVIKPGGRFAWTQWLGPDKSDFFSVVFAALSQHANMDVGLPPAPQPFRLSDTAVATTAMQQAGFEAAETDGVPIVLHAPAADFMGFFEKFAVRTGIILERQEAEARQAIAGAIDAGLKPFSNAGSLAVPMPAIVVSGRKPA